MMQIPPDAWTWDRPRLETEIEAALPHGWQMSVETDEDGFTLCVLSEGEEARWTSTPRPAVLLALFDAYGWLALRGEPDRPSAWVRRREVTLSEVQIDAKRRAAVPDPSDLDPGELDSVYCLHRKP
jgi:hypothetical protein